MRWIPTTCGGAVNASYVVRVERDGDGSILHLTNGKSVKSSLTFDVIDGQLVVIDPLDDDDDQAIPF
jgi:hypothetical protein